MRFPFFLVSVALGGIWLASPVRAGAEVVTAPEKKVPHWARFERTLEVEGYLQEAIRPETMNQTLRIRTRYLDPAVQLSVGFMFAIHHFNTPLRLDEPPTLDAPRWLGNSGIAIGMNRGRHLWELDLSGALAGSTLGPALAFSGEHTLNRRWGLFHRTEVIIFTGDTQDALLDSDQGLCVRFGDLSIKLGYRVFTGQHVQQSGPRAGLQWRFQSPKIPFIFPSIG